MKKHSIYFYLFLGLGLLSGQAQDRNFLHLGLNEGLPQETVICISQDQYGFVWMGTSDGIVRFDGANFHTPAQDDLNNFDFAGLRIGAIQANRENLFIGTGQKGLLRYNLLSETTSQVGDSNENCTDITKSPGRFFASYYEGGIVYVDEKLNATQLVFDQANPQKINTIERFGEMVYLGTETGAFFSFDESAVDRTSPIPLLEIESPVDEINQITIIDTTMWLGTGSGLYRYTPQSNTWKNYSLKECASMLVEPAVTDIVQSDEILFVGSREGLFELQISEELECISHFKADQKYDVKTINRDHIYDMAIHENELFIGHNNLDVTSIKSSNVFEMPTKIWNLGNPSVFAILETDEFLFTGTTSGLVISEKNNWQKYTVLSDYRIRGIVEDKDKNIWINTREGLFVLPPQNFMEKTPELIAVKANKNDANSLSSNNLRSLFKDADGQIWVLTFNAGINRFTGDVGDGDFSFQRLAHGVDARNLPSPLTIAMSQDEHSYWVTSQKGLTRLDFEAGDFTKPIFKNYDERDGLITNGVLSSYVDGDGVLWVTSRKGLNKYIREEDRFISFGKRDGLSNTFVYNALDDSEDNLWLSTNGGLFKFHKKYETFSNYTPKDGVQSTEFNLGAAFKNEESGHLYFGGIDGLNIFDPSRIHELDKEGQLQITSISSKGVDLSPSTSTILETSSPTTQKVTFNHDEFPVNISFAAMDFRPNSNIQYAYKLLPDDDQWNSLDATNYIQLLTLSPKSYTLQIQGLSRGVLWSKPPLELKIVVKPPWYQSTVAYLSYLLLFLTVVYIYYKITVQRKLAGQEAQRLQDLDDLKSRFITNITHEFRTPLTIILGYLDTIKSTFNPKPDLENSLNTIEQNSNNLLGLVNQMLDLAKLEQGNLEINWAQQDVVAFTRMITNSFSSIAEENEISLRFTSEKDTLNMDLDPEKLRQILTNLLSNALKFSEINGSVSVDVSEEENQAIISITDEGLGIPSDELPYIFDRFYQVRTSDFKVSQGTGIGLALTKELVKLLNGTISVRSEMGKGTRFDIALPITHKADVKKIDTLEQPISIGNAIVPIIDIPEPDEEAQQVLVVEDNLDMARYITSCLQPTYNVSHAKNGAIGMEMATRETPDLILSDVMMPVMDGFEMTQKLQANEATNHIPIILLTSKAMQEDKIEGIYSGADVYLTKPFSKQELLLRIDTLIAKRHRLQSKYQVAAIIQPEIVKESTTDKNVLFLNKVIRVIHEHMGSPEFNSAKLAQELSLSDSQLYRKLKAINNTSTSLFIRKVRLEKAKELLYKSDETVSEIAYTLGFNDPNWFGKAFKEEFGMSPSEVRSNL